NNSVVSESGFGNIFLFQIINDPNGVASLNSLVANPERHYANIHTTVNGGGAAREQLAPANTALPAVTRVGHSAHAGDAAPLGLIGIDGTNLTKVTGDLSGWKGKTLPLTFNGSKVTIGGRDAPMIFVSPRLITAQVPADVATGSQAVVVTNANGAGTAA